MAWYDYGITQGFKWSDHNKRAHSGVDIGAPWNTAVTTPLSGTILFAQCQPWGGQVDVQVSYGGMPYVVTFLHLHSILVNPGQGVVAGQLLGYSGGDTRGPCPTQMYQKGKPGGYSDGPHIHFELTLGSIGPYHGGPPYKVTATSFTVDPTPLYNTLHAHASVAGAYPGVAALNDVFPGITTNTPVAIPSLDTLFAIPQATVDAVNAVPGIDNLIYRLHEAETFPGWKSLDQIAPVDSTAIAAAAAGAAGGLSPSQIAGIVGGALPSVVANATGATTAVGTLASNLNPGRLVYWIAGNLLGNARAAFVRLLYLLIGGMLFLALVIAVGNAQINVELDMAQDAAKAIAPVAEAAALVA